MTYPSELESQIKAGDSVVKFVVIKGGWIALTEERVIYHARVYDKDSNSKSDETGNYPISKITNIKTSQIKTGCFGKTGILQINMQGVIYNLVVGKNLNAIKPLIQAFNERS